MIEYSKFSYVLLMREMRDFLEKISDDIGGEYGFEGTQSTICTKIGELNKRIEGEMEVLKALHRMKEEAEGFFKKQDKE